MALNSVFDITTKSLSVYQKALSVTSNNIANANNPNYIRQRVVLGEEKPDFYSSITLGKGVKIEYIQRLKNQALDNQIIRYNSLQKQAEKQSNIISQTESLLSEPSDLGLSSLLTGFLNSFEELSVNPTSVPLRTSVIQNAQKLSVKAKSLYEGLETQKLDLGKEAVDAVANINNYLTQINTLNKQIYEASIVGHQANDILDNRDKALEELSKLTDVTVIIDENNVANVSIGGVYAAGRLNKIELQAVQENGKLVIKTSDGATTVNVQSGELAAMQKAYNQNIKSYQTQLDSVLRNIYDQVNLLHTTGYTTTTPPQTNIKFFSNYENGYLEINSEILNDVNKIAISADGTDGNNAIAKSIAALKTKKLSNGLTIGDSYSNLVSSIAYEKVLQDQNAESFDLVVAQLQEQKSNYSGVSLDEEMTDVLRFQRSYEASAKLINIADEMLQTLLNMV
jgi:flagellar hook-associated protein 1 FlgK